MSKQQLVVEVSGLKKRYGFKPILRGIDLTLMQGERVALLGANGVGKTTLLRLLAGLTKADAGRLCVAGYDIAHDAQQVRRLVGLVAHQPYLYEELTALENLLFFGRMYSVEHLHERAHEILQQVGLEKKSHERMRTLSRGQVQRLSWARALLHGPPLLLLDEPDTGLDQQGHELIDRLLAAHTEQSGATLFTTHQLDRALLLADRLLIISGGRVAYQECTAVLTPEKLQQTYQEIVGGE